MYARLVIRVSGNRREYYYMLIELGLKIESRDREAVASISRQRAIFSNNVPGRVLLIMYLYDVIVINVVLFYM